MKMHHFARALVVALAVAAGASVSVVTTGAAYADDKPAKAKALAVGDKAPALNVETFIKGSPVTSFEAGKVYVVEMWATWCGPCIRMFPHLSELQEKYEGKVTIIGVNVWEDRPDPYSEKTLEKVKKFVDGRDTMRYTVAYDGGAKKFVDSWGVGVRGIPHAYIVDQSGKIAWMGHPGGMDKPLEMIVSGKYDLAKAKLAGEYDDKINDKMQAGENEAALGLMLEKIEKVPEFSEDAAMGVFGYWMNQGDTKKAYEKGNAWVDGLLKDNAEALNGIAWMIVDPTADVADKNLDLAMKAATRANELTKDKDAATLDTLARVYFVKGDKAKAVEIQTKAVANAEGRMKAELEKALEEFKK